ncbi:phosphoribosylglycinamide formyltransferase [Halorhodospira abdelmalekii]|uniref:phosphoribosylglycinamide formyltransferase n=1 Tax=Halorhodospira abdelmalekii TaxID=421629 RepID=UPI003B848AC6
MAVLISGSGSNLQALLDDRRHCDGEVVAVLSNRAEAYGLQRAAAAGVAQRVVDHRKYAERADFDAALVAELEAVGVDLVVLAGFMRILTPEFVTRFTGRLLNIHPSLLPDFRGLHTHERALAAGVCEHGCTVHFVIPELDAGPGIVQGVVPVEPGESVDSLQQRVHAQEHRVYPLAVRWFCSGRLQWTDEGPRLDGRLLRAPLRLYPDDDLEAFDADPHAFCLARDNDSGSDCDCGSDCNCDRSGGRG